VAMTAINSHVILPIARECAQREGDLWIVYMGNNEMVGPFGAGTVFGSRAPGVGLVRAGLAIKSTRIGQLLDGLVQRWGAHSSAPKTWGGLNMFGNHQLRHDDPNRLRAYENFKRNLTDILQAGHNARVPVILCTVGSNLKNCAPFASLHSTAISETQKAEWDAAYQRGMTLEAAGDYPAALEQYAGAAAIDPQYAELQFRLGSCHLALTNDAKARSEFELARDYDTLAFRADTRINEIIKETAGAFAAGGVYFLDAARKLSQGSPGAISGNELFYEHVHLNFDGNYLLGLAFAEQVAQLLPPSITAHRSSEWTSPEMCDRWLAVSAWDRSRVWQEILDRMSEPPYSEQLTHSATVKVCEEAIGKLNSRADSGASEQTRRLYQQALSRSPADNFLHQNFAQFLAADGDLAQATIEAQHVCELLPQMPAEYYDIGNLLIVQGRIVEAEASFSNALAIQGDFVQALNGLAQIRANEQKTNDAIACLKRALQANPDDPVTYLNLGFLEQNCGNLEQAGLDYQSAARLQPLGLMAQFKQAFDASVLGLTAKAVELFAEIVQSKPEFWQARYLLGLELAHQGRIEEAGAQFWEVIRYRPDFAPAHLNLGILLLKQKKPDQGLNEFRITLQLDPNNPLARQYLDIMHSSTNQAFGGGSRQGR